MADNENVIDFDTIVKNRLQPPAKNPFDQVLAERAKTDETRENLSTSVNAAIVKNPDEYAKYLRMQKITGIDPDLITEDGAVKQEAERRAKLGSLDFDSLIKTNPKTVAFMSNPQNAAVSYDDTDSLTAIEGAYLAADKTFKFIRSAFAGVSADFGANAYGALAAPFGVASQIIGQPLQKSIGMQDPFGWYEQKFLELQQSAKQTGDIVAGVTGKEGRIERGIMSGARSFGSNAMGLALSMLTKDPKYALGSASVQTGGNTYGEGRSAGMSPVAAGAYAAEDAVAEYATEKIPVKFLLRTDTFKKNFLKSFINYQLREGATEQAATVWQDFNEWANKNGDKPFSQYIAERPDRAIDTAISTLVAGSSHAALAQGINYVNTREEVQNTQAFFDALVNGVNESKLHQRLPEKTREFISQLKEGGGIQNVYIPAEKFNQYFQSQERDPMDVAAELMGEEGVSQLAEATALGTDVVIPLEIYAEKIAPSEHHQPLSGDLRLRQGDMTANEFELSEKNNEQLNANTDALVETTKAQIAQDSSAQMVYNDLYAEAIDNGVPPSQADAWATLESARYRTRGLRLGVDPYSLWEKDGRIEIRRPGASPEETGQRTFMQDIKDGLDEILGALGFTNNASGESSASVEAINRQKQENDRGQLRFIYDRGTVRPVTGVDAVDTHARAGQVILQRGIGAQEWTVLSKGDDMTEGDVNRARSMMPKSFNQSANTRAGNPFPNSKAKDIQYHGSLAKFDKFATEIAFVTPNVEAAQSYADFADSKKFSQQNQLSGDGHVQAVWADIRNPAMTDDIIAAAREVKGLDHIIDLIVDRELPAYGLISLDDETIAKDSAREVINNLKSKGFDGAYIDDDISNDMIVHETWVAFNPSKQIMNAETRQYMQSAPVWYSELSRKVEQSQMNKGSGQQWAGFIKSLPGVKKDEIEWSGITDWLELQDSVTKADVLAFIEQNGVKVQDEWVGHTNHDLDMIDIEDEVVDRAYESVRDNHDEMDDDQFVEYMSTNEGEAELRGMEEAILDEEGLLVEDKPPFSYYQLPGGQNYKVLTLTLPKTQGDISYHNSHFKDIPNIVAHVRFNERSDVDNKSVLFIEEIQSDWAQQGKKKGFNKAYTVRRAMGHQWSEQAQNMFGILADSPAFEVVDSDGVVQDGIYPTESMAQGYARLKPDTVPSAPFVTKTDAWVGLVMKRMIRYAAEEGFSRIAWTTGEQQADRYDLSKQLSKVEARYDRQSQTYNIIAYNNINEGVMDQSGIKAEDLDSVIGKDLAKKIVADAEAGPAPTPEDMKLWEVMQDENFTTYSVNDRGMNVVMGGFNTADDAREALDRAIINAPYVYEGLDLKVGGDGMKAFYDNIVPKVAKDIIKKHGGELKPVVTQTRELLSGREKWTYSVLSDLVDGEWETTVVDNDGNTAAGPWYGDNADKLARGWIRDNEPQLKSEQPGFDITPQMKEAALAGMPLFQKERGAVNLGDGFRRIQLLEGADLSTFLHELGHTWLEELQADAMSDNAPQQLVDDWNTIRGWLGVGPDEAIPVHAHEQFARGAEAYFMEGRAPATGLMALFQRFRAWVKSVYKDLINLNVRLNDDVRSVFDRLIATDEEIDRAEATYGMVQMFSTAEEAGMTQPEFEAYSKVTTQARAEAQNELTADIMAEMKREEMRWWKEESDKTRGEVMRDAAKMPVYQAIHMLSRGKDMNGVVPDVPVKLSKDAILLEYGEETLQKLSAQRMRTAGWVYSADGGMHPTTVAKMFGFKSGQDLIDAMVDAVPMAEYVDQETQRRMEAEHGSMMDDGTIADKAVEAVHNDRRTEALATELRILRRKQKEVEAVESAKKRVESAKDREARKALDFSIPVAIMKDIARREIGAVRVRDLNPIQYSYAEIRAGKEAVDFAAKKDYARAAEAKQRQILNMHFFREAVKAKEEAGKMIKRIQRLSTDAARAKIGLAGQEWLDQLDAILDRYSFAPVSQTVRARTLVEWLKSVKDSTGEDIAVAPRVLDESDRINYRELPMDDLRSLFDTIQSIQHVAKKINTVIRNGKEYDRKLITNLMVEAVHQNVTNGNALPETEKVFSEARSVYEKTKGFFATNLRPEKIIERLDGGKSGIWHDMLWNPSVDAQNQRDDLRFMIMEPLAVYMEGMSSDRKARMNADVDLPLLGRKLTHRTLIGVALNVGNASNKDKLMRGGMWFGEDFMPINQGQLDEMLAALDAEDWKMVQTIWDSIEQLYPMLDDLNRRAVGLPLTKIEATPVETAHGTFRGGYWPAVADPRHSEVGERQENSEAMITDVFAPRYPQAATAHSFREERTEAAYPIQFDWERVLANHVNKAITDISYHEWVKQTRRILKSQKVKKAVQNSLGEDIYRSLEEWLVHQVRPIQGGYMSNRDVDSLSNTLLSNTVVAALGFKAATAIGNLVVAPVQASHQVRPDYMVAGFAKFLYSPMKSIESVHALSGEMRHRFEHYEQTFNIVLQEMEGKRTIRHVIGYWAMRIHLYVDKFTSTAIWMGKYQQEIDKGGTPEEAMRLADKTIRTTQTAGAPKDLSSFERDPRYRIFKMFIGPMIIMQNEMRGSVAGKGAKAFISPEVWATMFATWIIPSVLFELSVGRGPEDDEEWWTWALRKILLYPAMTVPFLRDAASVADAHLSGRDGILRSNPITDTLLMVEGAVGQALKEDADLTDFVKASTRAIGALVGLPVGQLSTTAGFLSDVFTGEYEMEGPEDLRYLLYKRKEQ